MNEEARKFIESMKAFHLISPLYACYIYTNHISVYAENMGAWEEFLKGYGSIIECSSSNIECYFKSISLPFRPIQLAQLEMLFKGNKT